MKLFAGNATPELAQKIADRLYIKLGDAEVGRFSDGEISVKINENVRGSDVFIIQSTCAPTNDNLMELIVMVDALRRASAGRITAVMPYFGYARQDRRVRSARVPITSKVVADFLSSVGVDRVLTVDLHAEQIQENMRNREEAAAQAQAMILEQTDQFMTWLRGLDHVDVLRDYRQHTEQLAQEQLQRARNQLAAGKPAEEVMAELTQRLTKQFLHAPTRTLREAGAKGDYQTLAVFQQLYNDND